MVRVVKVGVMMVVGSGGCVLGHVGEVGIGSGVVEWLELAENVRIGRLRRRVVTRKRSACELK